MNALAFTVTITAMFWLDVHAAAMKSQVLPELESGYRGNITPDEGMARVMAIAQFNEEVGPSLPTNNVPVPRHADDHSNGQVYYDQKS